MEVKRSLHEIEERLEFYYSRLHSLDEESREDQSSIHYLKDQISFWKKRTTQDTRERVVRGS